MDSLSSNRRIELPLDNAIQIMCSEELSPCERYTVPDHDKWNIRQDELCIPRYTQFVLTMFEVYQILPQGSAQHVNERQDLRSITACVSLSCQRPAQT